MRPPILVAVAFLAFALGCPPQGPGPQHGGTGPVEPVAQDAGPVEPVAPVAVDPTLLCLPFATCGCFQEQECVAGRLGEDGFALDIVQGPHAGETGHMMQHCLGDETAPTDCVDYVDPAFVCRRLVPSSDRAAKYLCAMDRLHPDFSCGFQDGVCQVL